MLITINPLASPAFQEMFVRGQAIGRYEGRQEGLRLMLRAQLTHRFGELSPLILAQIEAADAVTLERWGRRLLDAEKLEEIVPRKPAKSTTRKLKVVTTKK